MSNRVLQTAVLVSSFLSVLHAQEPTRIDPAQPEKIQSQILEAFQSGAKSVVIPAGVYKIPNASRNPHFQFQDLSDVEIDARGVTFIFQGRNQGGMKFQNCKNVRFRGATLEKEIPPFTQGVVESVSQDGKSYVVKIDKGYPVELDNPQYFQASPFGSFFDPQTRWWKPNVVEGLATRAEKLEADRFRIYLKPQTTQPKAGDLVAFRGRGDPMVSLENCSGVELTEVTIHASGGYTVFEYDGEGPNKYTITVKRGSAPAGAESEPLLSSNADGLHSARMRKGPIVEQSFFEAMHDDGIAIHGRYSQVIKADASSLVINRNSFRNGDPIRFFDTSGKPAGEAIVKDVQLLKEFQNERKTQRMSRSDNASGPYWKVALDREVSIDFDYLASNPNAGGRGYVIRNTTIKNHRGRGMLLKADDGLVEGSTVDGSTMGGIVLTPEFDWNESCYSRNVTLRKNTIRNVAYWDRPWAAMIIAAIDRKPVSGRGHQGIVIDGNTFDAVNGTNLFISSANGVTVRNNRFIKPQQKKITPGNPDWGVDAGSLIYVTEADNVDMDNNVIVGRGSVTRQLLQATPTSRVKGMKDGLREQQR